MIIHSKIRTWVYTLILVLSLGLITACGEDGGVGGAASDSTPPVIVFVSHSDGEAFNGLPDVTFNGTLSDTDTITDFVVSLDGVDAILDSGLIFDQTSFSFTLNLTEGLHDVRVDATDEAGNTDFLSIEVTYDNTAPAVAITGPADGAKYTDGNRNVQVTGTFSDANLAAMDSNMTVSRNGAVLSPAPAITDDGDGNFSFPFVLGDRGNLIEVELTDDVGNVATVSVNLIFPFLSFTSGQDAAVVIGQDDFVSAVSNGPDATTSENGFVAPTGNPVVANGILYIADSNNNRVLGYNTVPTANGAVADFVIGQLDMAGTGFLAGATELASPAGVATDGGKFFIADTGNNRVLIFNTLPTANTPMANTVVGQTGFGLSGTTCTADGMGGPGSVSAAGGKMFLADTWNNRVLIWNNIPTTHGQPADVVLGQVDKATCGWPVGNDTTTLQWPTAVWSDGAKLIVVDQDGVRTLIWNTIPTTDNAPADVVVGQANFTDMNWGENADQFSGPVSVTSNGNQLFILDWGVPRVAIWNTFPTTNGTAADVVLGQDDFGLTGTAAEVNRFFMPTGLTIAGDKLIVNDTNNNRVLIFQAAP